MTNEEIKKLAEQYANEECGMSKHKGKRLKQLHEDKIVEFYDVFGFLIERYGIVDKNYMIERYKESKLRSESEMKSDILIGNARVALLDSLFGKSFFNEDLLDGII